MEGFHVEGMEQLNKAECQERHGHCLDVFVAEHQITKEVGSKDKSRLHEALDENVDSCFTGEQATAVLSRLMCHDIAFRTFHSQRERR